jgi:hypothetical protein
MAGTKTIKQLVQESIGIANTSLILVHKELVEANLNEDGTGGSECFEINEAYERIADSIATFKVYADKM